MEIILHRRNTIELLKNTPSKFGVEVDLRTADNRLIINHDPFKNGISFSSWIKNYKNGTLIINVKEDGLEEEILFFLKKYKIRSFFFLDQPMPSIIKTSEGGEFNCAVRVSEFESIETALNFRNKVKWVWVDMFTKLPINHNQFLELKNANFKLCLVSPELQIKNKLKIGEVKNIIFNERISFDAVCTKFPEQWIKSL